MRLVKIVQNVTPRQAAEFSPQKKSCLVVSVHKYIHVYIHTNMSVHVYAQT